MWSRRIEDLLPEMQPLAWQFINKCNDAGFEIIITCTLRTQGMQDALYMQGRETLEMVNEARKKVGLWSITENENKKPVTWTHSSNHVPIDMKSNNVNDRKSRAFDFAIKYMDKIIWEPKSDINNNQIPDYEECGKIAESIGLKWGGRFKNPDPPHIEI